MPLADPTAEPMEQRRVIYGEYLPGGSLDVHNQVWQQTRSALDLFPYEFVDTSVNPPVAGTSEPYTEQMMQYCRTTLGTRCVLGNNGLRSTSQGPLIAAMYSKMQSLGK